MSLSLSSLSAKEIGQRIQAGELCAESVLNTYLKRIEQHDEALGAFLQVYTDRALEKARQVDLKRSKGERLGCLAGVPIGIKDNLHVKGELTTCASRFLSNYRSSFDATVVELLEKEDAIILGKTNLDEFSMGSSTEHSAVKTTRNPWNLSCVPGGSSGGSAVAVAGRLCPLSLGSDTGGSIRQPAAYCGVLGMKPTYGRISRYGLVAFASSLDQIGPFAHHAEDLALLMEVLTAPCSRDSTQLRLPKENFLDPLKQDLQGIRIGVPWHFLEDLPELSRKNLEQSLALLQDLGAQIVEIHLDTLRYSIPVYYILATAEASTNLARFDGVRYGQRSSDAQKLEEVYTLSREEGFGNEVKRRILLGSYVLSAGFQDAYYKKAQKVRTLMLRDFQAAFSTCDAVAMPVAPSGAFEIGSVKDPLEMYLTDCYTIAANLAGLPALSLPSGFTGDGRPLGLQLLAPQLQDALLCRLAYAFEQATPYNQSLPRLLTTGETVP